MRQTTLSQEARDARPVPDTAAARPDEPPSGCRTPSWGPTMFEGAAGGGLDLRATLLASQGGDARAHARLLAWIAARARARMPAGDAREAVVQDCLLRVHAARVTYQPSRCPRRWAEGVIDAAFAAAAAESGLRRRRLGGHVLPSSTSPRADGGGGAGLVSPR